MAGKLTPLLTNQLAQIPRKKKVKKEMKKNKMTYFFVIF